MDNSHHQSWRVGVEKSFTPKHPIFNVKKKMNIRFQFFFPFLKDKTRIWLFAFVDCEN